MNNKTSLRNCSRFLAALGMTATFAMRGGRKTRRQRRQSSLLVFSAAAFSAPVCREALVSFRMKRSGMRNLEQNGVQLIMNNE